MFGVVTASRSGPVDAGNNMSDISDEGARREMELKRNRTPLSLLGMSPSVLHSHVRCSLLLCCSL